VTGGEERRFRGKSFTTKSTKDTKIHKELQKKEPERVIDLLGSSS
jgi:hypothetical protein